MAETEHITVADTSDGPCGTGEPGTDVSLPVVELLTGRGFITGKSGSGKSNSASVIAEKLLDSGFGLLIVDIDGEYYGLKEEYEILHAGADEECDVQITADHAEKMATLALEKNVPIILDVSSFLDESAAETVLTAISRHLFAKAKKQKQPFLALVEEVHEYIPENGSVGECGKTLIKISKRGRKHGLGVVGISQRPADVKKDFITQCDWLVWHRLTWDNDTKVVRRVLDGEYAEAVEGLDDGEGFLMTDWSEPVLRVQFRRKRTFDAGATPGLDDFERPDLKSVSADLVSELAEISEQRQKRENRVAELREQLDRKNSRIAELERKLQDARDLQRMADQFVNALFGHVEGSTPGRTEQERTRNGRRLSPPTRDDSAEPETEDSVTTDGTATNGNGTDAVGSGSVSGFNAEDVLERLRAVESGRLARERRESPADGGRPADTDSAATDTETGSRADGAIVEADGDDTDYGILGEEGDQSGGGDIIEEPLAVRELKTDIAGLDTTTRQMLAVYREHGPETAPEAHEAAGGDGDRTAAYVHNRALRTRGLIEHVGQGHYDYQLRDLLCDALDGVDGDHLDVYVQAVEGRALGADAG